MDQNFNELKEYLLYIKNRENRYLEELRQSGNLATYILNLHQEMADKYPQMIVKVYTQEEIDNDERGL